LHTGDQHGVGKALLDDYEGLDSSLLGNGSFSLRDDTNTSWNTPELGMKLFLSSHSSFAGILKHILQLRGSIMEIVRLKILRGEIEGL
jgi:hypothetical protein